MDIRIVDCLETSSRFLYGWISDNDDLLGTIVYVVHSLLACTIAVLIVVSHTLYPMIWFQFLLFCIVCAVWIQHIVLKTCVLTSLERRLLGEGAVSMDPILDLFGIPVSSEARAGITLLVSTLTTSLLGLELVARCIMYGRAHIGASIWF